MFVKIWQAAAPFHGRGENMLIPGGQLVHGHLSTSFTDVDQLIEGRRKQQFSGFCLVNSWEYAGMLFFDSGVIVDALENRAGQRQRGAAVIPAILEKAREKDGELAVHQLPTATIRVMLAMLDAIPKYKGLSTDLTSLDKVIGLLQKDRLSGYIEILLEEDAGLANIFFANGVMTDVLLTLQTSELIGESSTVQALNGLCHKHGAAFNVYQAQGTPQNAAHGQPAAIPPQVVAFFEALLANLEIAADQSLKPGAFQMHFKKMLPQVADAHPFMDPFLGDFRYANNTLTYEGDAKYSEFLDGMFALIEKTVSALVGASRDALLPRFSKSLEAVAAMSPDLMGQLNVEARLPELFRDYSFWQEGMSGGDAAVKGQEPRKALNLQGIGAADASAENILREFYRTMTVLAEKYADPEANLINYAQLRKSNEFKHYRAAAAFLQKFNPAVLKGSQEQIAFWLNLYNFLALDGVVEYNIKASVKEEKNFFSKTSYRLGEYLFSLDDIEHGLLRNNQPRPYSQTRQFEAADPRNAFRVKPIDRRLHCCLMRAAKSAPPLTVYTAKQLDAQIAQAARRYLVTAGMRLDQQKRELWLPRALYWYRKDFEASGQTLLDFVMPALRETPQGAFLAENRAAVTLRFLEYDWNLNGK